jgi:hypothetical protein
LEQTSLAIVGAGALTQAWASALMGSAAFSEVISEADAEGAIVAGLMKVFAALSPVVP